MDNLEHPDVLLIINKGKDCFNKKDYLKAEILFQEALQLNPFNSEVHFELGKTYYVQKKVTEAANKLTNSIQLEKKNVFAHFLLGKIYKEKKEYKEAIKEFEQVLGLGHKTAEVYKDLSEIYKTLGKFDLAAKELENAFGHQYSEDKYHSDLRDICQGQIKLIQLHNSDGFYYKVLKEIDSALKFVPNGNKPFQNILLNEREIAQNKISLSSKIRSLTVTLTNRCNLACLMCQTRDIPWEIPRKTLKEIISLFPYLERVMWQGGEVFLFDGFKELLEEASRYPMRHIIVTNGLLMTPDITEIMVKSNVELTISIDGATKEVYEYIRRGAKFEKLIENIDILNELRKKYNPRMQTRINVLAMEANYSHLEEFLDFAKKYNFNTIFFNSIGCDFRNEKENIFFYRNKEALNYIHKVKARLKKRALEYGLRLEDWLPSIDLLENTEVGIAMTGESSAQTCKEQNKHTIKKINPHRRNSDTVRKKLLCHAPWQRLYVDCGGEVRPDCLCVNENIVGRLPENSLEEIWNGERIKEYRRRIVAGQCDNFCKLDCFVGRVPEENLKFV